MKHTTLLLALLFAPALGCSGGTDVDRPPAGIATPYAPPADRIDPAIAAAASKDYLFRLGATRAARAAVLPTTAQARYVSAATGDDAGPGSAERPWRTLGHAVEAVGPDTTVWVDDSGDYEGGIELFEGGTDGGWVVFAAMPGTRPRITGAPGATAVVHIEASWITFAGFEIADHQRSSLDADTIGIAIEANEADVHHVSILSNVIHGIGPGIIDTASCYYNGHGIIAQSEGHRISELIIDGNELYDLYVGHSEVLVVNGYVEAFRVTNNFIHDVNNIAIDIIGYEKNANETAKDGLVADNVVLDASNYWPYCSRGNCAYPAGDESSDGIYVDGGADLIIEYNVVGRADHGIELQSENGQLIRNVVVRFNLVFNSNYKNFTLGAAEGSREHDNEFVNRPDLTDDTLEACKP